MTRIHIFTVVQLTNDWLSTEPRHICIKGTQKVIQTKQTVKMKDKDTHMFYNSKITGCISTELRDIHVPK